MKLKNIIPTWINLLFNYLVIFILITFFHILARIMKMTARVRKWLINCIWSILCNPLKRLYFYHCIQTDQNTDLSLSAKHREIRQNDIEILVLWHLIYEPIRNWFTDLWKQSTFSEQQPITSSIALTIGTMTLIELCQILFSIYSLNEINLRSLSFISLSFYSDYWVHVHVGMCF